jgi:hypothetical protein
MLIARYSGCSIYAFQLAGELYQIRIIKLLFEKWYSNCVIIFCDMVF